MVKITIEVDGIVFETLDARYGNYLRMREEIGKAFNRACLKDEEIELSHKPRWKSKAQRRAERGDTG